MVDGKLMLSVYPIDGLSMLFFDFCNSSIKPRWCHTLLDVFLKCLTFFSSRVHNAKKGTGKWDEQIMIWASSLGGPYYGSPLSTWRKARDFNSSSRNLAADVMIQAILNCCLNQGYSLLSASKSTSLMINSSNLLQLEAFSKESWANIFIYKS